MFLFVLYTFETAYNFNFILSIFPFYKYIFCYKIKLVQLSLFSIYQILQTHTIIQLLENLTKGKYKYCRNLM